MVTCGRMRNEFWRHNNSETGQTEQSDSLEMNRMCKIGTLRREMRKIQHAIFFLTPGILLRFLAKKCENIAKSRQKMIPAYSRIHRHSRIIFTNLLPAKVSAMLLSLFKLLFLKKKKKYMYP